MGEDTFQSPSHVPQPHFFPLQLKTFPDHFEEVVGTGLDYRENYYESGFCQISERPPISVPNPLTTVQPKQKRRRENTK
ncbi:hypothetical protein CEXT_669711 [Caerostris extrusa]|uniref:Uncharacterized protein n=1 Tax=Caerostris extrusa TaxID=172846 RepID=A0AAV4MU05_CAEEX|nr:hypothetical protein CEXT_669711 [Caerostris extrusa]